MSCPHGGDVRRPARRWQFFRHGIEVLVYITCVSVIGLAIERLVSRPLHAEASRPRETPLESGTALDVAGNGRYARKVVIA